MTHMHKHFLSFIPAILLTLLLLTACSYQEDKTPPAVSTLTKTVSIILSSTPTPKDTFPPTNSPSPTITHTPSPTPTTTAVVLSNDTEKELDAYLRRELSLSSDFELHFERGFGDPEGEELIVFYVQNWRDMPRRGIIKNTNGMLQIELYEEDPCYCVGMDSISQKQLVPSRPPFLVVEYVPLTGTCVWFSILEILIIEEGSYFKQALVTSTYSAGGEASDKGPGLIVGIADVEYKDIDGNGISEIIRNGKIINCGDECFCWEGPVEEEYIDIYVWDEATETFVEQVVE